MATNQLSQVASEVLQAGNPNARFTQSAIEVLQASNPDVDITQSAVEVLVGSAPNANLTQVAVEVLVQNTPTPPPPTCHRQTLTGGRFQSWDGQVLANGFLGFELSEDAQEVCTGGLVVAGLPFRIFLDNLGSVAGRPQIWSNDNLDPVDTYYVVNAFRHDGTPAWRTPQFWVLPSLPDPYDVGNIVPVNPPTPCCPPLTPGGIVLLLQTNGVNNGSQTKLNLVQGTGMSITDDGLGNVTFVSTGGGGGGGGPYTVVTASSTGSVAYQATPFVVELDTTGASNITRTLPTAVGNAGSVFVLKKVDSGVGVVTIAGFGGQTIDGASNWLLTNTNQYLSVVSDGSVWWSIANN